MRLHPVPLGIAFTVLLALGDPPAWGAPIDSDFAAAANGGGCYPTAIMPELLDLLTLVNPEWAPLVDGTTVDSNPILLHGMVESVHGDTGGDFPATHVLSDVVMEIALDPVDADRAATGNPSGRLGIEWEVGAFPAFAWPGEGDRVVALGRWIFDCGHPDPVPGSCSTTTTHACVLAADCASSACPECVAGETCIGAHFGYESELHPPQAMATIRAGRGAVLRQHGRAVRATRADVYVSGFGGGAGDRCILAHQPAATDLLRVECFPLAQPVAPINAHDFEFDVPLPPRPPGHGLVVRVTKRPVPGDVPARLRIRPRSRPEPHLAVRVLMTRRVRKGRMPTGFAATIVAGWRRDPTPLTHVRVIIREVIINNALQPTVPVASKGCSTSGSPCATAADCPAGESCLGAGPVKGWDLQAAVNGEWQEFEASGLEDVAAGDVIPVNLVYDQYLPAAGALRLVVNGEGRECIDTMLGKSLATDLAELGFSKGLDCLTARGHTAAGGGSHDPGVVDVTYRGADFGAGIGVGDYLTTSTGGEGGTCSLTTAVPCVFDEDCPSGETCVTTGGAFSLRYRIERLCPPGETSGETCVTTRGAFNRRYRIERLS